MKEYYGKSAQIYHQTKGKKYLLIPSILKYIKNTSNGKLLDVACGNGDFSILVSKRGYQYYGFDVSKDMINRAKIDFPQSNFLVASAVNFSKSYKEQFDIILISMLMPALGKSEDMVKSLKESTKLLKQNGIIIIGVTHPCFDHYMQSFLFNRKDVKTKFTGYYSSGTRFKIPQKFNGGELIFEDYHWTLSDYLKVINKAGLKVVDIDECKPISTAKNEKEYYNKHLNFPTYLTIVVKK